MMYWQLSKDFICNAWLKAKGILNCPPKEDFPRTIIIERDYLKTLVRELWLVLKYETPEQTIPVAIQIGGRFALKKDRGYCVSCDRSEWFSSFLRKFIY